MEATKQAERLQEIETLRQRLAALERELSAADAATSGAADWRSSGYYLSYYATAGFFLGIAGALTSLVFNIVGSLAVGQAPLRLIQIYLTFGMGQKALDADLADKGGLALAVGCCLYVGTGMLLGILFHVFLTRYCASGGLGKRLLAASGLAIAVWIVNYYFVLSWLQPLLFGGNWIANTIPPPIAALTHLAFGWTQALVYPLGLYEPYRAPKAE
jgi:hypothetical protein